MCKLCPIFVCAGHVGRRRVPPLHADCPPLGGLALLEAAAHWRLLDLPHAGAPPRDRPAVAGCPREVVAPRQLRDGRHDGRLQFQGTVVPYYISTLSEVERLMGYSYISLACRTL